MGAPLQVGREDEFSINRQQMLARIRVCMGGTVAEELIFGRDEVCMCVCGGDCEGSCAF